jgi:hypothetical protein
MSLQGPIIVVAESPATDLIEALGKAGAFPIIEANWAEAPTAFISVKPAAVIIAEPGPPRSESSARMLCLQIATASGPIVPTIACVQGDQDAAVPVALPADASMPVERLIARLEQAMRVRALHATVLRRIEMFTAHGGALPSMPVGDALDDATVLIAGRGPLYPALSVAIGERVNMLGGLSVETAARHLNARDIDGIVVGDGFSPRMVEAFLTVLAQDTRYRDIPVAVIGEAPADFAKTLTNIDHVDGDPARVVTRMVPLVRMHAFEGRLKRMLKTLDADGMFDPQTGLLTCNAFWHDLQKAIEESADSSLPLSIARFSVSAQLDERASRENARMVGRLFRNIDFGTRDEDGSILIAFTQTDLHAAHVVARRIAGAIKAMLAPMSAPKFASKFASMHPQDEISAHVTLATLKAGDTVESLAARIAGSQVVAAE